jgi:hypothetical protein
MVSETRIRFATFRDFLSDLGFRQVDVSDAHTAFQHDTTDTLLALPVYKANQYVAPHHLAMFRAQLDAKGILDGDDFDRLVASARIKQTAS